MKRENAVIINDEEALKLYTVDQIISYLIECNAKEKNIYCIHNGEKLYSCDGYTYDEYYILATGISFTDKQNLDNICFEKNRTDEDSKRLVRLIMPIYTYLKEMYKPIREELRNGNKNKTR